MRPSCARSPTVIVPSGLADDFPSEGDVAGLQMSRFDAGRS